MPNPRKIKKNNRLAPDTRDEIHGLGVLIKKVDERAQKEFRGFSALVEETRSEVRGLGALVEETRDEVRGVAEQYGDIKKTLDSHTKILDSHTEMIGSLATDMAIVKEDIAFIKNSVKRKVDVEEFAALERRVLVLEKRRA